MHNSDFNILRKCLSKVLSVLTILNYGCLSITLSFKKFILLLFNSPCTAVKRNTAINLGYRIGFDNTNMSRARFLNLELLTHWTAKFLVIRGCCVHCRVVCSTLGYCNVHTGFFCCCFCLRDYSSTHFPVGTTKNVSKH